MPIGRYLALAVIASALPVAALAQNAEVHFWLKGSPNSLSGCIMAEPAFDRDHTFLLTNGQAEIKSAGGINIKLKPSSRPGVYTGDFDLGRMNLNIVADVASTPKTLTVTSQDGGCKWSAVKE